MYTQFTPGLTTGGQEAMNYQRNLAILGNFGPQAAYQARGYGPGGPGSPVPGGGGYGGYGGRMGAFLADWSNKYDNARNTNLARYDQILGGSGGGTQYTDLDRRRMARGLAPITQETNNSDPAMGGYKGRFDRNMGRLETLGDQEKRDLVQRYDQLGAANAQQLASRGLSNSTIAGTMRLGTEREKSDALGRVNERLQRERIDTDARLSGDTLQFMERRNDTYPEQQFYANLLQQYGNSGAGGSGYGGAIGAPIFDGGYSMPSFGGYSMPMGWGGWGGGGGGFRNRRNMNSSRYGAGGGINSSLLDGGTGYGSSFSVPAARAPKGWFSGWGSSGEDYYAPSPSADVPDPYWAATSGEYYGSAYSPYGGEGYGGYGGMPAGATLGSSDGGTPIDTGRVDEIMNRGGYAAAPSGWRKPKAGSPTRDANGNPINY